MIVVFGGGIWVSAMEFGGTPPEAVIRAIAQDRFAVCDQIEEEVVRVLNRKFGWEAERVRADLASYWLDGLRVELEGTVTGLCRDPKDEPILECAKRAAAECILTGDQDLLSLASYRGIRIMTARLCRSQRSTLRRPIVAIVGATSFKGRSAIRDCCTMLQHRIVPAIVTLANDPRHPFRINRGHPGGGAESNEAKEAVNLAAKAHPLERHSSGADRLSMTA